MHNSSRKVYLEILNNIEHLRRHFDVFCFKTIFLFAETSCLLTLYNKTEENCNTKGWKSWPKFLNLKNWKTNQLLILSNYTILLCHNYDLSTDSHSVVMFTHVAVSFYSLNSKIGKYKMFSSLNVATNASFGPIFISVPT